MKSHDQAARVLLPPGEGGAAKRKPARAHLDWGTGGKQPLIMLHGIGRVAHTFDHIAPHFTASN